MVNPGGLGPTSMPLFKSHEHAIYCEAGSGPTFGVGRIYIYQEMQISIMIVTLSSAARISVPQDRVLKHSLRKKAPWKMLAAYRLHYYSTTPFSTPYGEPCRLNLRQVNKSIHPALPVLLNQANNQGTQGQLIDCLIVAIIFIGTKAGRLRLI